MDLFGLDALTLVPKVRFGRFQESPGSMALAGSDHCLFVGLSDRAHIRVYCMRTGERRRSIAPKWEEPPQDISFHADRLYVCDANRIYVLSPDGDPLQVVQMATLLLPSASISLLYPFGQHLLVFSTGELNGRDVTTTHALPGI